MKMSGENRDLQDCGSFHTKKGNVSYFLIAVFSTLMLLNETL